MRRDDVAGALLVAALTLTTQVTSSTAGQAGSPAPGDPVPFASCEALRSWYVEHTIGRVGPYGWDGPAVYGVAGTATRTPAAQAPDEPVVAGPSGTNTQEPGVDETDVAKTDGRIVVQLRGDDVVVTDVSGATARELATWAVPAGVHPVGLLLVADHVLLLGATGPMRDGTQLFDLDVADPSAPRLVEHTSWSGQALAMRQYGDSVRLVTSTGLPALPFVQPGPGTSPEEAAARNRDVVRSTSVQQWLPWMRSGSATSHRTTGCGSVYAAAATARTARTLPADLGTVAVTTLHVGSSTPVDSVAVAGGGTEVYSSADRLYVFGASWTAPPRTVPRDSGTARGPDFRPLARPLTELHAFAVDGDSTRYVASGRIAGQVRDRWSLDEQGGLLRAVVSRSGTLLGERGPSDNAVVVLEEQDGRLVQVGQVQGLGPDEDVRSVRWLDDLAVLVTYRETDPLWTVDLADARHPRLLGELRLPGYSAYLHPLGGGRVLGLGVAGPAGDIPAGVPAGAQAAVFDLADPSHPRRLGATELPGVALGASADPHDFTWLSVGNGAGTAITSFVAGRRQGVALLTVSPDGRLTTRELGFATDRPQRALPLPGGRIALVGAEVRVLADVVPSGHVPQHQDPAQLRAPRDP